MSTFEVRISFLIIEKGQGNLSVFVRFRHDRVKIRIFVPNGESNMVVVVALQKEGALGAYAIKRVAAGAHLPISWLFEPTKRPDDRADYCLNCSFLLQCEHQVLGFTRVEWARPMGEQW